LTNLKNCAKKLIISIEKPAPYFNSDEPSSPGGQPERKKQRYKEKTTRRNLYIPARDDLKVQELADKWEVSLNKAYYDLIELGLEVVGFTRLDGEIIANLPGGKKITLANKYGIFKQLPPRSLQEDTE
jgi:hypothetical protein